MRRFCMPGNQFVRYEGLVNIYMSFSRSSYPAYPAHKINPPQAALDTVFPGLPDSL